MPRFRHLLVLGSLALLAACGPLKNIVSNPSDEELGLEKTEEQYYQEARGHLDKNSFEAAIESLNDLESRYPFGRYAEQAQLELIYAHYRNFEPEAARAAAERFIRLHPRHPRVDYAYYMRGLATFVEGRGLFERFLPTDLTRRDPGAARDSFAYFAQLLARFPNSVYAPDAEARMIYLRNLLARYEIHVAYFYLQRQAYLAAANRGRYVVENYQQTPAVPDALAILAEAYLQLGMKDLADNSLATLRLNYPSHPALDENGNYRTERMIRPPSDDWLYIISFGLFGGPDEEAEPWEPGPEYQNPDADLTRPPAGDPQQG